MRLRILLPVLCWLAVVAIPFAAAADPVVDPVAAPLLRTGSLEIALDPDAVSVLPIDSGELRSGLCNGLVLVDGVGTISPRGECDLVVSPPPGLGLYLEDTKALAGGSWRVSLQAESGKSGVWKASGSVSTSCGLWEVSMALDPDRTQPVSELALEPSAADPTQGVFAGALKLAVRYRFDNQGRVPDIELPATVSIDLSGHWMAIPEDGPSLGEGASNLVLFAGTFVDRTAGVPSCVNWGGVRCEICFEPAPDVIRALETLNPDPNLRP